MKYFDDDKLPNLIKLELQNNKLTSTKGIRLSKLKKLYFQVYKSFFVEISFFFFPYFSFNLLIEFKIYVYVCFSAHT